MADSGPFVPFVCASCEQPFQVAAADGGTLRTCPGCGRPTVTSTNSTHLSDAANSSEPVIQVQSDVQSKASGRWLRGACWGAGVSTLIHLFVIAVLSTLVFQAKILEFSLVTSLVADVEQPEAELVDMPVELTETTSQTFDGNSFQPVDVGSTTDSLGNFSISGPEIAGGGTEPQVVSGEAMAGFSPTAIGRLKKNSSAKQGDYEIALYWDGPSDLDLHVLYHSNNGRVTRSINYLNRGTPGSGFLDLDQNSGPPHINDPIEHVRWNSKKPPMGSYQIGVHGFHLRGEGLRVPEKVSFTVEIKSPDGVKTHMGSVGQDDFEEIDTLAIGLSKQEQQDREAQAERLLTTAKEQLDSGNESARITARGILKNIDRKFPTSKSAIEARKLLQQSLK